MQSFVLESRYNHFGSDVDVSKPFDASDIIGKNAARRLGETGSAREQQWLKDLAREQADKVVLWYSSDSVPRYALNGITAQRGHGNRPELIPVSRRSDSRIVNGIFARLGYDLEVAPVIVIGGEAIHATESEIAELRSTGDLTAKLASIGWRV